MCMYNNDILNPPHEMIWETKTHKAQKLLVLRSLKTPKAYQWEMQSLYVFTIQKCNFQDIWSLRETSAKQNADGIWAKELGT